MHNLIRRVVSLSLLTALSGACVEKEGGTTEDTTGGNSGDSTGGNSGDSTGDETGATGDESGDSSGSASATGETGEPTTGETEGLCQAYAQWSLMCEEIEPGGEAEAISECEMQREFYDVVFGPECGAKIDVYLECAATHSCDDEDDCEAEILAVENCEPEASETCEAYAAKVIACEPGDDEADIAASCQFEINAGKFDNPACGSAAEAMYSCFAGLECADLFDGVGCEAQAMMYEASCTTSENGAPARPRALEFETHRR